MRKEYNPLTRICQEYFAVHGEYADRHKIEPISTNLSLKQKKSDSKYMTKWALHCPHPFTRCRALV